MTVSFTNQNKKSNYILDKVELIETSPEDYGAVGDGVTDDTTAFQLAFNSGKRNIILKSEQYKVSGTVSVPSNINIDLGGSTINIAGQTVFNISNKENVTISNGKIKGYTDTTTFAIVITGGSSYCQLKNIFCEEVNSGFYFGNCSYIKNTNLKAKNCRYQAFTCINSSNVSFANISTYNACWGMNSGKSENIEVVNGIFELGPLTSTPTGGEDYYTDVYSNGPEHGVYFQNSNHIKLVNCIYSGWNFVGLVVPKSAGIKFRNGEDFQVIGGTVKNCWYNLSLPSEDSAVTNTYLYLKDVLIKGVVFEGCTKTSPSILVWDKSNAEPLSVEIDSCVFRDTNAGTFLQRYSLNNDSRIILNNCQFEQALTVTDNSAVNQFLGSFVIQNCYFSPVEVFAIKIFDAEGEKIIRNNTFIEANKDSFVPTTDEEKADYSYISLGNKSQFTRITDNEFIKDSRRVGILASTGTIEYILICNNVGGGDLFIGGAATFTNNFMSNNTNYSATIPVGITSAVNNTDLNNPTVRY